ncbi:MAG: AzlC family ABC transporter permease [Clostridia bacterium]|nr:AzlC family ABC transporter permease [Clostridia bacterium]
MKKDFLKGLRHSVPIAVGYFAVSFSFGILTAKYMKFGFSAVSSGILSLTNVTSAGQFAAVTAIVGGSGLVEMAILQFIINLRYALMGFSLNQKLPENMSLFQRSVIAFGNTDEIFAVAISDKYPLSFHYMLGLESLPIFGWTAGTVVGFLAGEILPKSVTTALGIALYGMLISIVMPVARQEKSVRTVVLISIALSCLFFYIPLLNVVNSGFAVVICTVLSSSFGAYFFPVKEEENEV